MSAGDAVIVVTDYGRTIYAWVLFVLSAGLMLNVIDDGSRTHLEYVPNIRIAEVR